MARIIINNKSSISDLLALELVSKVISMGRISNDGKQYCYLTHFECDLYSVDVISGLNLMSDSLTVVDAPRNDEITKFNNHNNHNNQSDERS